MPVTDIAQVAEAALRDRARATVEAIPDDSANKDRDEVFRMFYLHACLVIILVAKVITMFTLYRIGVIRRW